MTELYTLDRLEKGTEAKIITVLDTCSIKNRLFDLGFTSGADIRALQSDGHGSLRAYEICGTVVAVRKEDAQKVALSI